MYEKLELCIEEFQMAKQSLFSVLLRNGRNNITEVKR